LSRWCGRSARPAAIVGEHEAGLGRPLQVDAIAYGVRVIALLVRCLHQQPVVGCQADMIFQDTAEIRRELDRPRKRIVGRGRAGNNRKPFRPKGERSPAGHGTVAAADTEPALAAAQIRRFLILPKELDADDGELTRTRKVRRRIVAERYRPLVDALYSGRPTGRIETEITFEDGRKGSLRAELAIRDTATTLPPPEPLALRKAS